jgi:hypothetical protein
MGRAGWGVELKGLNALSNVIVMEVQILRPWSFYQMHHGIVWRGECLLDAICRRGHKGLVCEGVVH